MKIIVNGTEHDVAAATLAEALIQLDYGGKTVATALNGCFVPTRARASTPLSHGDKVEIIAPMQGG